MPWLAATETDYDSNSWLAQADASDSPRRSSVSAIWTIRFADSPTFPRRGKMWRVDTSVPRDARWPRGASKFRNNYFRSSSDIARRRRTSERLALNFSRREAKGPRYCLILSPSPVSSLQLRTFPDENFVLGPPSSSRADVPVFSFVDTKARGRKLEESSRGSRALAGQEGNEVREEKSGRERESEERGIASFTRGVRCKFERERADLSLILSLSLSWTFIVIAVARVCATAGPRLFISSGTAIRAHMLAI